MAQKSNEDQAQAFNVIMGLFSVTVAKALQVDPAVQRSVVESIAATGFTAEQVAGSAKVIFGAIVDAVAPHFAEPLPEPRPIPRRGFRGMPGGLGIFSGMPEGMGMFGDIPEGMGELDDLPDEILEFLQLAQRMRGHGFRPM